MKNLFLIAIALIPFFSFGQKIKDKVNHRPEKTYMINAVSHNQKDNPDVKAYHVLSMVNVPQLLKDSAQNILLDIDGLPMLLYNVPNTAEVYEGSTKKKIKIKETILSYEGVLQNFEDVTIVSLTFSQHEIAGFINLNGVNYIVGKMGNKIIYYDEQDLLVKNTFKCEMLEPQRPSQTGKQMLGNYFHKWFTSLAPYAPTSKKQVSFSIHTKFNLYKGSIVATRDYVVSVFAMSRTLYANDGITISNSEIVIWDKVDPYTGTTSGSFLSSFGANLQSWNGDLASLWGTTGGGGVAYVNVIEGYCQYGFGWGQPKGQVSAQMSYCGNVGSTPSGLPTYHWVINVVCHEWGHNIFCPHTHSYVWVKGTNNQCRIDCCGQIAGYEKAYYNGCYIDSVLVGGGTMMSYCHLTSYGINFNKGFGPQPTAAMLRVINNSTCLKDSGYGTVTCPVPIAPASITGTLGGCQGLVITYTATPVSGATGYAWTLPSTWSGASTTNTIAATVGSVSGQVTARAINSCGTGQANSIDVNASVIPSQPAYISGSAIVAKGSSQTYSVPSIAGVSYVWTLPSGWTGLSTTNSITVAPTVSGNISVQAKNNCGLSAIRTLFVTVDTCTKIYELRIDSCPAPQKGNITYQRYIECKDTSSWYIVGNSCVLNDTIYKNIICSIKEQMLVKNVLVNGVYVKDTVSNFVVVTATGMTNLTYQYTVDGATGLKSTSSKLYCNNYTKYKLGSRVKVTVGSTNPKVKTAWWVPCTSNEIIIKY